MDGVNIIRCPHCNTQIEPWDYIETGDMEGEFTLFCENELCKKEFKVEFETTIMFRSSTI